MIALISVSLAALIILAGLYLLAKSKKDSLGSFYLFSSYSAIALGTLLFVGSIVGGVMSCCHHSKAKSSCHAMMKSDNCGENSCSMMQSKCSAHHGGQMGMMKMKRHHQGMHNMKCSGECKKGHGSENCACPHCPHKKESVEKEVEVEEIVEE